MRKTLLLIFGLLASCTSNPTIGPEREAKNGGLQLVEIPGNGFVITSFQRIQNANSAIHVYIEGDGFAWITRTQPSRDPTPKNALALKLALKDTSPNVVYLARPCQYSLSKSPRCNVNKWTDERFSPEMVDVMNDSLDSVKSQHPEQRFDLIGYSGGATIALMLAASRNDILSLRTVAGNLSPKMVNAFHKVSEIESMGETLVIRSKITNLAQVHFYGENDDVMPRLIAENYLSSLKDKHCTQIVEVKKASHNKGWVEVWPSLLNQPVTCLNK